MLKVTRSKRLTINMGNYESYVTEITVDVPVPDDATDRHYEAALKHADDVINTNLIEEVTEAAGISDVRNTYVLTWLKNREKDANA